jgi:hypothetical protein
MISEQNAIHVPTSALRVRALADMAVAIEVTRIRPTGWQRRRQVVAEQARTVMTTVLRVLASWSNPSVFERVRRFCMAISNTSIRVCQRALAAAWTRYVDAHTWTLDNGLTVWIDEYQTFVIDTPGTLDRGSMSEYDQWLEAQVLGW